VEALVLVLRVVGLYDPLLPAFKLLLVELYERSPKDAFVPRPPALAKLLVLGA
jgi:hypothetical protein